MRGSMSQISSGRRSAPRADVLQAKKTADRTGSRPKPPEAGARSASLEPGRAPGYANLHSCSSAILRRCCAIPCTCHGDFDARLAWAVEVDLVVALAGGERREFARIFGQGASLFRLSNQSDLRLDLHRSHARGRGGGVGGGISRTEFATYLPSLYVAGVACVIAAALVLTIGSRRREALAAA